MSRLDELLRAYDNWEDERSVLAERDAGRDKPAPKEWEASDERACDLLRWIVTELRHGGTAA